MIDMKLTKKININKFFVTFTIIVGFILSIIIPLYMIPDETTHINMIYEERNLNYKFNEISEYYRGSEYLMGFEDARVEKKDYFDLSKKINVKKVFSIPKVSIIRHLPQALGMMIGEILHLPVFFYLMIMEICALLFYTFICNKALKKMPFKKSTLMVIMLLPICLQQMASVSYDVMLLSISFLYIASIFELKFTKEKITLKDILLLFLYLIIITICKLPYGALGLLMFILPLSKFEIELFGLKINGKKIKEHIYKHKIMSTVSCIIVLSIAVIFAYRYLISINSGRVLIASISHPFNTAILLARTVKHYFLFYVDTIVGKFGIFNVTTNKIIDLLIIICVFVISMFNYKVTDNKIEVENNKFSKKDLFIIFMTLMILVYFIILAMFEWTLFARGINCYNDMSINEATYYIKQLKLIGGVQGRYFVPILPLLLVPLGNKKIYEKTLKLNPILFQTIYYCLLGLYMIIFLLFRYWI